ncbi:hypothetical protein [Microbacterium sp. NPDC090003]|uniref:hypothetical protein n=1 Tax=Microbacterium sp. NPDC090003 TaxID=3364203 RepID=UPI0037F81251
MTSEAERDARGDAFLSVFLSWMLTVFTLGISVVALLLITVNDWGRAGADPGVVSALTLTYLVVGIVTATAGIALSLAHKDRASIIARVVLGVVVLSAVATIVAAWVVSAS